MNNKTEVASAEKELEVLQDMFIFLLLRDSIPQQTVRKIVKVNLSRVMRIDKLLKTRQKK